MIDKIFCGDCLEVMKDIPDDSVDMILTDLPYGVTACDWDVVIPFEPMWGQFLRIAKKNAAIVLTATNPFASDLIQSQRKLFRYEWVWVKSHPTDFVNSRKKPMCNHELVLLFSKDQVFFNSILEKRQLNEKSKKRYDYPFKSLKGKAGLYNTTKKDAPVRNKIFRLATTVKSFHSITPKKSTHPTQKPVSLFQYLIQTYTQENEIVLDCCAGSGTTGVAARNCNRRFILIEQEFKYCRIARERIGLDKTRIIQSARAEDVKSD